MSSSPDIPRSGVVLIDKPEGITSFSALSAIKKRVGHGKVGHAGTLDKFATGLLIVLVGPYTRLNSLLSGLDKSYEGILRFGETTETLDPEGEVTSRAAVPAYRTVEAALEAYRGTLAQIPPKYSAVHVGGERAYRRALAGEDVSVPSRQVKIHRLEPVEWNEPELSFTVSCSKGTYIRSLARDIGCESGSLAYLTALRRTAVGPFSVEQAVSPGEFDPDLHFLDDARVLEAIPGLTALHLREEFLDTVLNGTPVSLDDLAHMTRELQEGASPGEAGTRMIGLLDGRDRLVSIVETPGTSGDTGDEGDQQSREGRLSYRFVIPGSGRVMPGSENKGG